MKNIIEKILVSLLFVFFASILFLLVRGHQGNPKSDQINNRYWKEEGPFELSPDRGRFALLYSIVEDNSLQFSLPVARFVTPDLGYSDGKYVSLFAPGVSYLAIPGYLIGKYFGISQVGAWATSAFFALLNGTVIYAILKKLKISTPAALLAVITFMFATPALSYSGSLYQHHISTFIILSSLYLLFFFDNFLSLFGIWFLTALSIPVDYPNIIITLPVIVAGLAKYFTVQKSKNGYQISFKTLRIFAFLAGVIPLLFFLWFNNASHGDAFKLTGTLPAVKNIGPDGKPMAPESTTTENSQIFTDPTKQKKSALGFFQSRRLLDGFYVHILSPDRGTLYYAPVIFIAIFGAVALYKKDPQKLEVILSMVALNLLLYSLWGDPWGGYAFGSRYMIPAYALLSLLVGVALDSYNKNWIVNALFAVLLTYSIPVNLIGAITSNSNPPQIEVLALEQITKRQEKYTYARGWDSINQNFSKSYFYNTYLKEKIDVKNYFYLLSTVLITTSLSIQLIGIIAKYRK